MRGAGRVVFAAALLLLVGTINIIYGIGALDGANIFVNDTRYILTDLNTMGWVLIVLGLIQLTGGFSLIAGNTYGRVIGIIGGSLGAIGALLSIGGRYPWWSLAVFALCVYVVYGIIVYGEAESATHLRRAQAPEACSRSELRWWANQWPRSRWVDPWRGVARRSSRADHCRSAAPRAARRGRSAADRPRSEGGDGGSPGRHASSPGCTSSSSTPRSRRRTCSWKASRRPSYAP